MTLSTGIAQRCQEISLEVRLVFTHLAQPFLNVLSARLLRATEVARHYFVGVQLGQGHQIFFSAIGEGANQFVGALIADQPGGHAFGLSRIKEIEQECFNQIISVMA